MKNTQNTAGGKGAPTAKQNQKPGFFKRIGRGIKETFGELKKVSWPTVNETVKQLGAVIAVVLLFLVVLMGFDYVLGLVFDAFKQNLAGDTAAVISSLASLLK